MTQRWSAVATLPAATAPFNLAQDGHLCARFQAQVARTPEAIAIGDEAITLSYRELNLRANQLARVLRARGVHHGDVVAIAIARSAATIVGMLAVLKAGAAYLPLDPSYPRERLRAMIADAGPRVVLVHGPALEHGEALTASDRFIDIAPTDIAPTEIAAIATTSIDTTAIDIATTDIATIDIAAIDLAQLSGEDLREPGDSDDLAYIMYTSGSTGAPKGVLITHGAICNLVSCTPALAVDDDDVVAQLSNIAFDGATYEIWAALLNGARLEIIARDIMLSPADLSRCLRERRVSVAFLTSALLAHISRETPAAFATLRCLIAGGDVVDPAAVRAIFANGPPKRFLNGYGPSETTTFATTYEITAPPAGPIPIGWPLGNVQAYILDDAGRAVPIGTSGQLHIGGLGLARGYLNDPELTARKFTQHEVAGEPPARVYATGDLARYLPDGNIEFLGRADRQVKIRGFRVELGEIEIDIKALPDVRDAIVMLREDEPGEKRLVAFIVDDAGVKRSPAQWRSALARRLPDHMLPEAIVTLEAIPLNANGKVDARALTAALAANRALAADPARSADAAQAPRPGGETTVAGILADVLGLASTGRHENFFALGGHSLLAMRAIARLSAAFDVDLSLRDFFAGPTVAELAHRLEGTPPRAERSLHAERPPHAERPQHARSGEAPRAREQGPLVVPLSSGQLRLWLLAQLEPGTSTYNVPYAFALRGPLDRDALRRALRTIVGRHDVLRAIVTAHDGEPACVVREPVALELPLIDLPVETTLEHVLGRDGARRFDLATEAPIRTLLVRRADDDHVLLVTLHHIATDGWSMGIFKRELGALYDAYRSGATSPLAELSLSYADFARREHEPPAHDDRLRYWRTELEKAPPPLDLAPRRTQPAASGASGGLRSLLLGGAAADALETLCRAHGTTLFSAMFAAFGVFLHHWTGRRDFVIGAAFANRTCPDFEDVIGFFVNTLPLRVRLAGDPRFVELLAQVRRLTADAFDHQDVPFAALVEAARPTRAATRTPLVDVMLVVNPPFDSPLTLRGLNVTPIELDRTTAKFDLTLEVTPLAGDLRIAFEYRTELFDAAVIDSLLASFVSLLTAIVEDPRQPIGALPVSIPSTLRLGRHDRHGAADDRAPGPSNAVPDHPAAPVDTRQNAVDAPQNEAQAALRALWETLLGVRPIGISDNFFELGGHSLLAIRLLAHIERSFGIRLSPAVLFEEPTIAHLARAMCAAAVVRDRETAAVFNPRGSAQPLFFLHGSINGGGFYCRVLADRLGPDRPLYAIDPHRFAGAARPPTIEAMAADNVALVRRIAPHGPYLLGGYCSGGLVAFEMARRLRADGERVTNVILLDVPAAPLRMRPVARWIETAGAALRIDARHSLRLVGMVATLPYRAARLRARRAKVAFVLRRLIRALTSFRRSANGPEGDASPDTLDPWFRLTEAFVPRPYDGALTLLLTRTAGTSRIAGRGWAALAPRVDVRGIPGTHITCITEFVGDTADIFSALLAGEP